MKIQKIISISVLLTISSTQCMELVRSKDNTNINQAILKLDNTSISRLKQSSQKNKSNPLLLSQQTKNLNLLQQLLDQKANITFSNGNESIKFWLDRNDWLDKNDWLDGNEKIIENILYYQLLSLLSYKATTQRKIKIDHTPFNQQEAFTMTLHLKNSLLHVAAAQPLQYSTKKTLVRFLRQYTPHNPSANPPPQQTDQYCVSDQNSINTKGHSIQLPSDQKSINTKGHSIQLPSDQKSINTRGHSIQLPEEEYNLFVTLPHNTRELLIDIFLD